MCRETGRSHQPKSNDELLDRLARVFGSTDHAIKGHNAIERRGEVRMAARRPLVCLGGNLALRCRIRSNVKAMRNWNLAVAYRHQAQNRSLLLAKTILILPCLVRTGECTQAAGPSRCTGEIHVDGPRVAVTEACSEHSGQNAIIAGNRAGHITQHTGRMGDLVSDYWKHPRFASRRCSGIRRFNARSEAGRISAVCRCFRSASG